MADKKKNNRTEITAEMNHIKLANSIFEQTAGKSASDIQALLGALSQKNKISGQKYETSLQLEACLKIALCHNYGNVPPLKELIDNMAGGARKNAMIAFIEEFAPVNFNEKESKFVFAKKKRVCAEKNDGDETFQSSDKCAEMLVTPWIIFKPEPSYRGIDMVVIMERMIKQSIERITSQQEADKVTVDQVTAALIAFESMGADTAKVMEYRGQLATQSAKRDQIDAILAAGGECYIDETTGLVTQVQVEATINPNDAAETLAEAETLVADAASDSEPTVVVTAAADVETPVVA